MSMYNVYPIKRDFERGSGAENHEFYYGRFGHLSTKITIISKRYYSLNTWSFSNLKTELCRGR